MSKRGHIIRLDENQVGLTPGHVHTLGRLIKDGAWTDREVAAHLPPAASLYRAGVLQRITTRIGDLTVLTPHGCRAIAQAASALPSPMVQTSKGYVRLALAALDWPEGGAAEQLLQYDTSGRMRAAMTDEGPALVVGKLPAGYSLSALRGIRDRLKSTTLEKDFWVVSLSPTQRNRQFAQQNSSWFRLVSVVPDLGSEVRPQAEVDDTLIGSSHEGPRHRDTEDEGLSNLALSRDGYAYGSLWSEIMQLPREGRIDAFHKALACDGVISEQQLGRIYGLTRHDLENVSYVDALVRPLHSRPAFQLSTRFFLRDKHDRNLQWSTLDHAASVAEIRVVRNLSPDVERWQSTGVFGQRSVHRPDAVYLGEWGPEAIEYDRGTYTPRVIENKLSAWRDQGFDDVYWGVPSLQRRARLSQDFAMSVLHVRWF